jgi:hypothetical protein
MIVCIVCISYLIQLQFHNPHNNIVNHSTVVTDTDFIRVTGILREISHLMMETVQKLKCVIFLFLPMIVECKCNQEAM